MASNSLKSDLALESKSKHYPNQENFLPQNRFLKTLQFKHFRILETNKLYIKPNPKHFAGEKGRDE